MINRPQLKYQAKLSMKSSSPSAYLVSFVYLVLSYILNNLYTTIQLGGRDLEQYYNMLASADYADLAAMSLSPLGILIILLLAFMAAILSFGFVCYCLRISRNQNAGVGELFDGFAIFFKVIALNIVTAVFVALWSLLFVIPGIIAAYRYSMAIFVLADSPDTPVMECIRRSKALTSGYKGSLFVLDLSFIGWNLLSAIPLVGLFIGLFVTPYYNTTLANYYNVLSGWRPRPEEPVYEYSINEP